MSIQGLKLALAPPAWALLCRGARLKVWSADRVARPGPFIFACLHRDILPAIIFVKPARPALLVSHSPDGDILLKTLGRGGYRFVRGATGEGGGRALVGMRRELESGHSVGVAVDGPKGPFGSIHEGILHLARITGAPVIPLKAHCRRALVLDTWDRTVVPLLWGSNHIEVGDPIDHGGTEKDQARMLSALTTFFDTGGSPE
jgi:lysophospholipid acyltransferase (LPLAT)-like uncharacterized protein